MSAKEINVFTPEWCDAVKDWYNDDKEARVEAKGMTIKGWYVVTGCPEGVDKIVVWEFEDGLMKEMKMAGEAPSPNKEWRIMKLPFEIRDWWGGWVAPYNASLDLIDPIEEPGQPIRAREDIVQFFSDKRVGGVGLNPFKAYPIKKKLKAWLDSMAKAQKHYGFARPRYVPNGSSDVDG